MDNKEKILQDLKETLEYKNIEIENIKNKTARAKKEYDLLIKKELEEELKNEFEKEKQSLWDMYFSEKDKLIKELEQKDLKIKNLEDEIGEYRQKNRQLHYELDLAKQKKGFLGLFG